MEITKKHNFYKNENEIILFIHTVVEYISELDTRQDTIKLL